MSTGRKEPRYGSRDSGDTMVTPKDMAEEPVPNASDSSAGSHLERRGSVADRRRLPADRRQHPGDRRGIFADRRRMTEARYRAPLDARMQAQQTAWQERERWRIAADLHDSIGSSLCTIRLKLQEEIEQLPPDTPREAALATIVSDVARAMDELRRIAMDLRPSILDDLGITATINWLARELETSRKGLRVEKRIDAREEEIPQPLKTAIFRILQESLGNTLKHGKARLVRISLFHEAGELRLLVEDDGAGFDIAQVLQRQDLSQHFGMANMRHRASSSGGSLVVWSAPGEGTVVRCSWPRAER